MLKFSRQIGCCETAAFVTETSISIDDRWILIKALLLPKSSTTVKRRWNGFSKTSVPAFSLGLKAIKSA